MMPYLVAGVVGAALLSLISLWFVLVATRAVNEVRSQLRRLTTAGRPRMHPVGAPVAAFAALTVDGEPVSDDTLRGWTLVAVVNPTCAPCAERIPEFLAAARSIPGGRSNVLAVVATDLDDPTALVDRLRPVARVVVEPEAGPVARAFRTAGYPSFAIVSPDRVVAFGGVVLDPDRLPRSAASV